VSKTIRITSALCAVLFALLGLAACGGGVPSGSVVKVGEKSISKPAFEHWLAIAATSNKTTVGQKVVVPDPPNYTACIANLEATAAAAKSPTKPTKEQLKKQCEQQYKSLQSEVLNFLIGLEWVLNEAPGHGVNVTDAEVHKQFVKIRTQQFPSAAEFEKFVANSGQSVSDLLLRVKYNLASQKLQQKILKTAGAPTQAQVEKYYSENKSRFGVPEKRVVEIILTKEEATAKKAKQEIESGKSFASVARSTSIDPTTKAKGGVIEVSKGQEEKALDEAIFSAQKGVLSGPIKTAFGYYIFEVISTTPGTQQSLAAVQASIKQQLTSTQQQAAFTKFVKEFKKKWKEKTECAAGYVVEDCKQYKAPKTVSTGTAVP